MIDRTPAHSIEAERGVLGCILLSPNECLPECVSRFKAGPEVFYDLKHQTIYECMVEMADRREAIDVITLHQRLKDKQVLEGCGGLDYIAPLPDTVASSANIGYYATIVLEKYITRQLLNHCIEFGDKAYEHTGALPELLEAFESSAMGVADSLIDGREADLKALVKQRLSFYEDCLARGGGLLGLSTGYPDLDRMLDGMKGGDMIVLAARPSMGKTSLAMNIAEHVAIGAGLPVGVFSLEMSADALVGRLIASRGRINERVLTRGKADEREMVRVFKSSTEIAKARLHIDDTGGITITQLRAKARRMVQRHGVKLLVIDYLQLLRTAKRRDNRREEIDEISNGVKACAKELKIPVIAICQLNRELEKDKERKPRVSDLRESGQIEQDADVIGLLYCPDQEAVKRNESVLQVNLLIAKQRNGPTGDVNLTFFKDYCRFESVSRVADEPRPARQPYSDQEPT